MKRVLTLTRYVNAALIAVTATCATGLADEEAIAPEEVKIGRPVEFQRDIYPIFQANCIACHNRAKSEGDLSLEDGESIMKGGSSGAVVVPGKPDESYLYNVAARKEESYMPPLPNEVQAKKLTGQQVGLLRQWIVEGAKAGPATNSADMKWQAINPELNAIYAVDADPWGRFVAAGRAGTVTVYDLVNQENSATLKDPALAGEGFRVQTAHRDYVHAVAFHPSGEMIATSGFQVVKIWQRDMPGATIPVGLPQAAVRSVAGEDGSVAVVQTADGVLRVIDRSNNKVVGELSGIDPAKAPALGLHGNESQWISVGAEGGAVRLLNRADGAELATSEPLGAAAVQTVYLEAGNRLVVLLDDGSLRACTMNLAEKKLVAAEPVKSDKGAIRSIAAGGGLLLCRTEGAIVELRKQDSLQPGAAIQCAAPVSQAAISADGQRVVTVSGDGKAELWNAADGKLVAALVSNLLASRDLIRKTSDKAVRDARVAVVKKQIEEDEKRVKEQKDSLAKAEEELKKATEALEAAKKKAAEETPKVAAAQKASDEKPDDAGLKKKLEEAQKAEKAATDAVTSAENTLKSAQKGKQLSEQAIKRAEEQVAERNGLLAKTEEEAKAAADSHAAADATAKQGVSTSLAAFVGSGLAATVDRSGTLRLWKVADGAAIDQIPGALPETSIPVGVASGRDAVLLQLKDGRVVSINAYPEWKLARMIGPSEDGKSSAFVDRILALAFSPDGNILATGGGEASRSGELMLWNVADGKLIRTFEDAHSDTVYGVDFSRDGKRLASAAADKFVKVFDLATGEHIRSYEGHTHHVMDVSWKGDGTQLVSAGADNAIKVWDAETGEQARTITTYNKQVTSLSFIGMGDEFISCSGDKRVFRHRASNGGTVREFKGCPDYVYCSATTADGGLVAAGCEDGVLRIWNGADAKEVASFSPAQQ